MRILITHERFLPESWGGGETIMYKLAKGLQEKGHEVHVLTTGNPKVKEYDGIPTIRIPINRYLMNLSFPIIYRYAKDFDLIQTTFGNMSFPSWLAAKLLNKPISCLVLNFLSKYSIDMRGKFVGTLFYHFGNFLIEQSYDSVVVMNNSIKDMISPLDVKAKIYKISPGFDLKPRKYSKKEKLVMFVGNLNMNKVMSIGKGLNSLIDAAKQLPEIKFYVVGKGEYIDEIKDEAPNNIVFTGALFGKKLYDVYKRAAIYCQPSLSDGFGLAIAEAMASGCAILATTDLGQDGIIVKQKDVSAMIKGLRYLANNPKVIERMGRKNIELSKQFTWKKFLDGFEKMYDEISV